MILTRVTVIKNITFTYLSIEGAGTDNDNTKLHIMEPKYNKKV